MSVKENIELIARLDLKEAKLRTRASFVAWGSVLAAALCMVMLVSLGSKQLRAVQAQLASARNQLESVRNEQVAAERARDAATALSNAAKAEASEAQRKRDEAQKAADDYQAILSHVDKKTTIAAVKAADSQRGTTPLLPRVYLQIVNQADRGFANLQGQHLQSNGFIVLGTEYVPKAAGLKHTDVRYYKMAEKPAADRIVSLLRANGVADVAETYLNLEHDTKVRANHFEVWFAAQ